MEWNRPTRPGQQPAQPATSGNGTAVSHSNGNHSRKKGRLDLSMHNLSAVILLFSVTIVVVGLLSFIMLNKRSDERKFVDKSKMQAVFLNGGQVYFGKINSLNEDYVRVNNIYYLRVNQQVQPDQQKEGQQGQQDISLVKLGCELHGPADEMLINSDQVVFWENLKDDGQVAKAVGEYIKANPDGQKCQAGQQQDGQAQQQSTTPTPTPKKTTP